MEQEFRGNPGNQQNPLHYAQLASMLVLFLHSPSPDLEYRLSQFPPSLCLQLILNPSEPREVRQACCASLKAQILNRSLFTPHAETVIAAFENIHFTADPKQIEDIAGSFEILQEKLFEMYLDDEKKLQAFAGIMQRISNNSSLSAAAGNLRGMQMAVLLVRAMDVGTINNEVCVGELICYLKQLYYPQNVTQDPHSVNGKGLDLLRTAMGEVESEGMVGALLDAQVEAVKLVGEIIERVEVDIEEGESVPAAYVRNSAEIDNLFQAILCVSPVSDGRIYSTNPRVNQLKAVLMGIYLEQYPYHISEPFLLLCFSTIAKCTPNQLYDDIDLLLSGVLQLVERSSSHGAYAQFYYAHTQIMIIRLFELSSAREAELKAAEEDAEHFAEIADDYCKNQDSDSVKIRAGSLIYNLCLTIDGTLTFVTNMAMIPLYALEGQLAQQLAIPEVNPRELCIENGKGLSVLLELWSGRPEALTDVSLLVLSCLSDLIIKRNEFNHGIRLHLQAMAGFFHHHRERVLALLPPTIVSRYIQLFSFYSYPHCLDPFLPLYPLKPLFAETILKSLQTVMHFHDKKSTDMRNYVSLLSTKILLLSEKLTPLLQQTILSRPQLILCIKEKLVEKLVNWLLDYYEKGNTFGSNKISNLLCKVIEQYPKFIIQAEDFSLDLEALNAYLLPVYRLLQRQDEQYNSQECLVDVAVQHLQCLGARVQGDLLQRFVGMGVRVVQHNGLVLNKCLELFSRTMAVPGMQHNRERLEYAKLHKMHVEVAQHLFPIVCNWLQRVQHRDSDLWQLLFLIEILLVTLLRENPMVSALNMATLLQIYTGSKCEVVKLRVIVVWMLVMQVTRDQRCQASQYLQSFPIPERLPPYERSNFMIYLMGTLEAYSSQQNKAALLRVLLKFFHPNEKDIKYIANYETSLHVSNNHSQAEISAFQTVQSVLHPLNAIGSDTYTQFRALCQRLPDWQQLRSSLSEKEEGMLRNVLGQEMVGAKPRRIVHIKRTA